MEKSIQIDTDLGVLHGRECIYLDVVSHDNIDNMTFIGEINGALVPKHKNEKEWFPYKLIFQRVLACFSCELDTYENAMKLWECESGSKPSEHLKCGFCREMGLEELDKKDYWFFVSNSLRTGRELVKDYIPIDLDAF
ncbi:MULTISPECIES: hypothetical protein [unclassified Clostridioides]|uniref:hypothetical protein n=1 Tax=unclassified Clostridioides TaxID=2635829 RepID=UPI001D1093F5